MDYNTGTIYAAPAWIAWLWRWVPHVVSWNTFRKREGDMRTFYVSSFHWTFLIG